MKKFTRILVCLMLFVFAFSLVACGGKNKDKFVYPTSGMVTEGNGGISVQKGNYLYFVNGYKSVLSKDITKKTNYNIGSLKVTKLDENGNPVTDDGGIKDDYFRTITDKLVGYEVTDLHIFGDYIYFASPCLENENVGDDQVWAKKKVVFYRTKLDNSGKVKELYQSKVDFTELDYTYYTDGGKVVLLVHETKNNKIVRIDCIDSKVSEITQATSVCFPEKNEDYTNIFYIKNSTLYRYNAITNASDEYYDVESSAQLKFVAGGYVYITMSHGNGSSNTDLYISKIATESEFKYILASSTYDDVRVSLDGNMLVCLDDKMLEYYIPNDEGDSTAYLLTEEESAITIIGFNDSEMVYYIAESDNIVIKTVSVNNVLAGSNVEVIEIATIGGVDKTYFDIENDYVYFYKTAGNASNLYLHRVRLNNPEPTQEAQMIGVFIDSDIVA